MTNLFIFGIGGSGSRVIKALVMLLASGVQLPENIRIIPIFVDPDRSNGDLNRTIDILLKYQNIRCKLAFDKNTFFRSEIITLNELNARQNEVNTLVKPEFSFKLSGVQNQKFKDFIDYKKMDRANQALASVLFSRTNLDSEMDVGFKGNPNIGSVVLNQFTNSPEFIQFASNFNENDRIFIISSIFGGSGAAGFPLVVKNIRNASENIQNFAFLRNAKIGAISILPYFGIEPKDESEIDKATFISKTKSALSYYGRNLTGNDSLNALYYIGDKKTKDYENNEGSVAQKNDAHFIELASALAVIDFSMIDDNNLINKEHVTSNNQKVYKAVNPFYKEFGVKDYSDPINFSHLGNQSQDQIMKPLSQYMFFDFYLERQLEESIKFQPWANRGNIVFDENFISQKYYNDYLTKFNSYFREWIVEMGRNTISFTPFNLEVTHLNLFRLLMGISARTSRFKRNFSLYDEFLNKAERQIGDSPVEQKFMEVFCTATDNLIKSIYNI